MRLSILLLVTVVISACQPKKKFQRNEGLIFGTIYHMTYEAPQDLSDTIQSTLNAFDWSMSTYKEESVISKLNRNVSNETDIYFRQVFNKALEITKETSGAFDMTVAPLVNAWGFGFSKKDSLTDGGIDSIMTFVGMDMLQLNGTKLVKQKPEIMLDGSAIAKGFAVDVVADLLEAYDVDNYMVEIGGEMRVKGHNPKNTAWRVGIDQPIDDPEVLNRQLQEIIGISDLALATSGNYRNFYIKDGKKYAHTISPFTGYPINHQLLGVSVLASDCMSADAYATAFMVLGYEQSIAIVEKNADLEAYFILAGSGDGYEIKMSTGFSKYLIDKL
ncbi:FAD:protein FMN transferase [Carboxylicivirga sp. M1479]|uniref:FAD:protein FMN transferase n=1 Tax=Carboxylicivirga sp. M1479 TaxID=2594476 RepID=UPI0011782971|nr:FAD:protein FMN transferase [Carboxylicivirga sp. M1479]TRX70879.1 FAD:protein FMN transferase [Carboxylicivirga sp. M1479]